MTRSLGRPARRVRPSPAASRLLLAAGALLIACGDAGPKGTAVPSAPSRASAERDANPLRDFDLTLENLNGLYLAHHELYRLAERNSEPLERLQDELNEIPDRAFGEAVNAIMRTPEVRDAIVRARLSPREYYLTQYNLVDAVSVLEARAVGRTTDLPDVSQRNVDFVRVHPEAVRRVMTGRRPPSD